MNHKSLWMKYPIMICIVVLALFMAPAAPAALAMQPTQARDPRFKLYDMGTFGGPNSGVNGPQSQDLNNNGAYGGAAETSIPDPFAPYCQNNECLVQHAQAWRNGVVSDLLTLPGVHLSSGVISAGTSGNNMVGWSENGLLDPLGYPQFRAVVWNKNGQITNLGTMEGGDWSFAAGINSRGLITGMAVNTVPDPFSMFGFPYQTRTFIWQHGAMQDIGTLGGPDAIMSNMNERGQISGTSYTNSTPNPSTGIPTVHPFLWQNGKMKDLGTLGGTNIFDVWMNNGGQVVGTSTLAGDQTYRPFLWDNGTLKDLGTFGGTNGEANWISDSGLIAGRGDLPSSTIHHAALWKNGVITDLGLVSPWPCSTANSVNSQAQVVGTTGICGVGGGPAFFSAGGQPMVDVNTLVLPGSNPSNITVVDAFQINDGGEIAGGGVLPNGDFHAVVLVPASQAEIAAANSQPSTSQSPRYLPSQGAVQGQSMLDTPRSRFLALFRRFQRLP